MATVALWAADLVRGKRRHLHFLQMHKCDVSLGHLVTLHRFPLFFLFTQKCTTYLDRFTKASKCKSVIRHQGRRWWMRLFMSQSISFLCTVHIWGHGNFPRLLPQSRLHHTVLCIFMCVPSYLNPSYYSHGWPCQAEICSLTVNGPILTARPPHQWSV